MARVIARVDSTTGEKEPADALIRRFKKLVLKENIIADYRKHEYFKPKSLRRKEKSIEAQKRNKLHKRPIKN